VDDKWLVKVGDEVHIKAGMKVVIEAGAELTIKAGGNWIRIDPSGVKTSPVLHLNQGPPGVGSGANPALPEKGTDTESGRLRFITGNPFSDDSVTMQNKEDGEIIDENAEESTPAPSTPGSGEIDFSLLEDILLLALGYPFSKICSW
jgi:type VI secretion system secreted protein VgrG